MSHRTPSSIKPPRRYPDLEGPRLSKSVEVKLTATLPNNLRLQCVRVLPAYYPPPQLKHPSVGM